MLFSLKAHLPLSAHFPRQAQAAQSPAKIISGQAKGAAGFIVNRSYSPPKHALPTKSVSVLPTGYASVHAPSTTRLIQVDGYMTICGFC